MSFLKFLTIEAKLCMVFLHRHDIAGTTKSNLRNSHKKFSLRFSAVKIGGLRQPGEEEG